MNAPDPRLRFRIWIGGKLVSEEWLDTSDTNATRLASTIQAKQAEIVTKAAETGSVWLAEVYDPAAPRSKAYLRFGTDRTGMHQPRPITELDLPDNPDA
jgi:hypothetical protein